MVPDAHMHTQVKLMDADVCLGKCSLRRLHGWSSTKKIIRVYIYIYIYIYI
jgi:hypothetical protein